MAESYPEYKKRALQEGNMHLRKIADILRNYGFNVGQDRTYSGHPNRNSVTAQVLSMVDDTEYFATARQGFHIATIQLVYSSSLFGDYSRRGRLKRKKRDIYGPRFKCSIKKYDPMTMFEARFDSVRSEDQFKETLAAVSRATKSVQRYLDRVLGPKEGHAWFIS